MRYLFASALTFVLFGLTACDGETLPSDDAGMVLSSPCPGPGCTVSAMVATCSQGYTCIVPAGSQDVACGAGTTCTGTCGDSCDIDCAMGATCTVTTGNSTSSSCDDATCTVTAGESASYDCTNGAVCDITMGAGSSASCDSGSTCEFVCTSTCGVQCRGDSTCTVQCPSDEVPRSFTGEVSCE